MRNDMRFRLTPLTGTRQAGGPALLAWGVIAALAAATGCEKDVATEASDSDANGYLCVKCGAKFWTDRSVFLASKCPKCQQDGLVEVVGYFCGKDHYLTLRGRGADRQGATACEKCGAALGGMRLPRQKDLKAWGATYVSN